MKQLTIRGLSDEVERTIRKEARQKGVSLNKAALAVLERAGGTDRPRKKKVHLYHDLDHLSGIWKKEEAGEMEKQSDHHRQIDEALWKR